MAGKISPGKKRYQVTFTESEMVKLKSFVRQNGYPKEFPGLLLDSLLKYMNKFFDSLAQAPKGELFNTAHNFATLALQAMVQEEIKSVREGTPEPEIKPREGLERKRPGRKKKP